MKFTIKNEEIIEINGSEEMVFPKYTSQLINWANQNAQGTRPRVVGQLSELFPAFQEQAEIVSVDEWEKWYLERYPDAMETATDRIYEQVENLRKAIPLIDKEMVRAWVKDLVISKTFNGLYFQQVILASLAKRLNSDYRLATPEEESAGIDGYVGDVPYSIKPETYKTTERLPEHIDVRMIYYNKTKTGLTVEVDD